MTVGATCVVDFTSLGWLQAVAHADANCTGSAKVTYNVNQITPDDPTDNPDFAVLIPTVYKLTDDNKKAPAAGEVSFKDAGDVSVDYQGTAKVDINITSAKNFIFENGGTYQLVSAPGVAIPNNKFTLSKDSVKQTVGAQLTKVGTKTTSTDTLTFNYKVQPAQP